MTVSIKHLFKQITGEELFQESFLHLNLLLQNAFPFIPFCSKDHHESWFCWRPKFVKKETSSRIWTVIISMDDSFIPDIVKKWIKKQFTLLAEWKPQDQRTVTLRVFFENDLDEPKIINIFSNSYSYPSSSLLLQETPFEKSKSYVEFCAKQSSYKGKFTSLIEEARNQYNAIYFFSEGFYIAPSTIPNAGYGLFSLGLRLPGSNLFSVRPNRFMTLEQFELLPRKERDKIEIYCFEAIFSYAEKKQVFIFDPTNSNHEMKIQNMYKHPNPAPWINEPSTYSISNVFSQPFICLNVPEEDVIRRHMLFMVAAKIIYPHEELFFHYGSNYNRCYTPGLPCPDVLPPFKL